MTEFIPTRTPVAGQPWLTEVSRPGGGSWTYDQTMNPAGGLTPSAAFAIASPFMGGIFNDLFGGLVGNLFSSGVDAAAGSMFTPADMAWNTGGFFDPSTAVSGYGGANSFGGFGSAADAAWGTGSFFDPSTAWSGSGIPDWANIAGNAYDLAGGGGSSFGGGSSLWPGQPPLINTGGGTIFNSGTMTPGGFGGNMGELQELLKRLGLMPGSGGFLSNIMNIGSGLHGMYQSNKMMDLAKQAAQMQDPFGAQRPQYQQKLSALYADPSSITTMPGYQAGLDAVERKMASQGYLGSGNMMAALQKYGGDFFDKEVARLSALSGAQFAPTGGNALITGSQVGMDLASRALASLGYGVRGLGW